MSDNETYIDRALAVEGGHLSIGRGGFVVHFANGSTLSGYDCEPIKQNCIARGLPVIDSRMVPFSDVITLAVAGPMVAVGRGPDLPPWTALSYAPLSAVAAAYRKAGAEVYNLDGLPAVARRTAGTSRPSDWSPLHAEGAKR